MAPSIDIEGLIIVVIIVGFLCWMKWMADRM